MNVRGRDPILLWYIGRRTGRCDLPALDSLMQLVVGARTNRLAMPPFFPFFG